jgi:hypothetical protein
LRLVETGVEGSGRSVDVMAIDRPGDLGDMADLGLTLAQGKQLVALVQQEIVTVQSRDHAVRRPTCRSCGAACQVKDYRPHQIATLFGQVTLRLRRSGGGCQLASALPLDTRTRSGPGAVFRLHALPDRCRRTRTAATGRCRDRPRDPCTLKVGADLVDTAATDPAVAASAITLTLDSTFIRSCEAGQRHLEVHLGMSRRRMGAGRCSPRLPKPTPRSRR